MTKNQGATQQNRVRPDSRSAACRDGWFNRHGFLLQEQ
jgi:hypothetical protein